MQTQCDNHQCSRAFLLPPQSRHNSHRRHTLLHGGELVDERLLLGQLLCQPEILRPAVVTPLSRRRTRVRCECGDAVRPCAVDRAATRDGGGTGQRRCCGESGGGGPRGQDWALRSVRVADGAALADCGGMSQRRCCGESKNSSAVHRRLEARW